MPGNAGLILAAGSGIRFGGRKLLASVHGRPMLQQVLNLAAEASLEPVIVVLGHEADDLIAACTWRNERRVLNPRPEDGLAGSVRLGIAALEATDVRRVAVLLGDQPFLTRDQLSAVLAAKGKIVVPRYEGRIGNPVVIDRSAWPLAAQLEGDRGFSQIINADPGHATYVDVPGTNRDVDTPDDLTRISRYSRRRTRPIRPNGGRGSQ